MSNPHLLGLVEEAIPTTRGHWEPYTCAVANGFKQRGWQVTILGSGHREEAGGIPVEKVFSGSIWDNPFESLTQPARFFSKVAFPLAWSSELQRHLGKNPNYSLLYAPNQLPAHLLAWSRILASKQAPQVPRLALGVNFFGSPGGGPPPLLYKMQGLLAKTLLASKVKVGRVHFFCENKVAQEWLTNFFGWPFTLLPHPVECAASQPTALGRRGAHFVALGFARPDKGSDILQESIASVLGHEGFEDIRFTLQWGDESMFGSRAMPKHPIAVSSPQVTYVDSVLSAQQVADLLEQADVVVLPYRNSAYYARLSRVAVEAVSYGLPVIYPRNSSIGEIVDGHGAGIEFEDGEPASLSSAIVRAAANLDQIKASAHQRRAAAQTYHSGLGLADLVLQKTSKSQL